MDFYDLRFKYNDFNLEFEIYKLFLTKIKLSLSDIKEYLSINGFLYTDEQLLWIIYKLFIKDGVLIKNDFWNKESEYVMVDNYRTASSYTKHYYYLDIDDLKTKKILLISDTHIGNNQLEDFVMIDKIYDYAINNGATKCFHLGDVFTGKKDCNSCFDLKNKHIQIKRFIDNYPKPLKNEMMTYSLLGNNDEEIDSRYWHDGYSSYFYDLRQLTYFNPSFYMFPRENISVSFLDKKFHFGHRFHHSGLIRNLRLNCCDDLLKVKEWLDNNFDVRVSGHLHTGLIYGAESDKYAKQDQLFLGVPATIKTNINKAVAYLITLNYRNEIEITDMDISILNCDSNYKVSEMNFLKWSFNSNNEFKKIKVL